MPCHQDNHRNKSKIGIVCSSKYVSFCSIPITFRDSTRSCMLGVQDNCLSLINCYLQGTCIAELLNLSFHLFKQYAGVSNDTQGMLYNGHGLSLSPRSLEASLKTPRIFLSMKNSWGNNTHNVNKFIQINIRVIRKLWMWGYNRYFF